MPLFVKKPSRFDVFMESFGDVLEAMAENKARAEREATERLQRRKLALEVRLLEQKVAKRMGL